MASTLGTYNPLRYRGYVYDQETDLYYLQSRYYNPAIGRFINADVYVSTGQGLVGNNMFVYCLDNPVNTIDPIGEDAIWLQDKDAVWGFGHTGLLLQDTNGKWYHFYWGATGTGKSGKSSTTAQLQLFGYFSYRDLETLNNLLNAKGIYKGRYDGCIYLKGDFSAGVKFARSIRRDYNLILDNCMQLSIEVLLKGRFKQSDAAYKDFLNKISLNPIPNIAYQRLRNFHNAVSRYYAAPWYLKFLYISPVKAVYRY